MTAKPAEHNNIGMDQKWGTNRPTKLVVCSIQSSHKKDQYFEPFPYDPISEFATLWLRVHASELFARTITTLEVGIDSNGEIRRKIKRKRNSNKFCTLGTFT